MLGGDVLMLHPVRTPAHRHLHSTHRIAYKQKYKMLTELAAVYLTPINKNKIYTETGSRKQAADVQNHSS